MVNILLVIVLFVEISLMEHVVELKTVEVSKLNGVVQRTMFGRTFRREKKKME